MQINAFRKELSAILASRQTDRPPVLRRSRQEEWIYVTDIPALVSDGVKCQLKDELKAAGWENTETDGWLFLRKHAEDPPEGWYAGAFGPEAACCFSVLNRHPHMNGTEAETAQRMLIKAGEEGEKAYERACSALHREWAECLRQGKPLPAVSLKYFGR